MFVSAAGQHDHDLPRDGRPKAGDRHHARAGATPHPSTYIPPTSYTLSYILSYIRANTYSRTGTCTLIFTPDSAATDLAPAAPQVRKALEVGRLEILPEIGISLLSAYHGAQIFEAIGLSNELVDTAFIGARPRPLPQFTLPRPLPPDHPLALASSLLPPPSLSPTLAPHPRSRPPAFALTRLHPRFAPSPAFTREQRL